MIKRFEIYTAAIGIVSIRCSEHCEESRSGKENLILPIFHFSTAHAPFKQHHQVNKLLKLFKPRIMI